MPEPGLPTPDPAPPTPASDGPQASGRDRLRPGTRDPHRSRERALKVLFQADLRGEDPRDALARVLADPDAVALLDDVDVDDTDTDRLAAARHRPDPLDEYAQQLIEGVGVHRDELDGLIERFARRWTVARMPVVDRNLLRLAAYELLHEDTAPAVVIDEALELAKDLSTDNSVRFVNGVLESVRRWHEQRPADDAD